MFEFLNITCTTTVYAVAYHQGAQDETLRVSVKSMRSVRFTFVRFNAELPYAC